MRIYGSYWDFGAVLLDIRDPSSPTYISRADIAPPDEDGDVHSVALAGNTLLVNPEDFSPVDCSGEDLGGWGEVHLFDVSNPAMPLSVGTFSTPNSRSQRTTPTLPTRYAAGSLCRPRRKIPRGSSAGPHRVGCLP